MGGGDAPALLCVFVDFQSRREIKNILFLSRDLCRVSSFQGYLFISVLVNSNSDLIRLINNAIKNDLASRNPTFMNLALHCIANVGSREMAEAFASEIPRILVAGFVLKHVLASSGSKSFNNSLFVLVMNLVQGQLWAPADREKYDVNYVDCCSNQIQPDII